MFKNKNEQAEYGGGRLGFLVPAAGVEPTILSGTSLQSWRVCLFATQAIKKRTLDVTGLEPAT